MNLLRRHARTWFRSTQASPLLKSIQRTRRETEELTDSQLRDRVSDIRSETTRDRQQGRPLSPRTISQIIGLGDEAIARVMGFRLHPCQLQAIVAAIDGTALQMQTGEGKTVVSAMIAFAQTFRASDVHLSTTNAYLAERDFHELQPVFELLGVSSGLISHGQNQNSKRAAYESDVTFGPGYQFGFDYLADQIALRNQQTERLGTATCCSINGFDIESLLLQPAEFGSMIVDEADSIMIDEALTPLILSGAKNAQESTEPYLYARQFVENMRENEAYVVSKSPKRIDLTQSTLEQLHEDFLQQRKRLPLTRPWQKYVENAIHAKHFLVRNEHYVVVDDEIKIVDQFTGRIFDDRQWQDGLHQAVQAKEGVTIEGGNIVQAQISRQRYFMLYDTLIGLSGTLQGTQKELRGVYRLPVVSIPTNRPSQRQEMRTRFFESSAARLDALALDVKARIEAGQPVLIGTRTIRQSLAVQEALEASGLAPVVLNGIQDHEEAEIVAQAGQSGALTIATNMAGRGTDIKLSNDSKTRGGLCVIGYEHNSSQRIDRQLVGRSARQGQPGCSQFYAAADDELIDAHDALAAAIRKSCRRRGECRPGSFAAEIRRIQRAEELNALRARQLLMQSVNWLDRVRHALANEKAVG